MVLKPDRTNNYTKILGVDSSTLGAAWTVMEINDEVNPVRWGMINTSKVKEIQDKLMVVAEGFDLLVEEEAPDHIFIEMPIFVKNPATARKLSFVVAVLMLTGRRNGIPVTLIEPQTWKAYLGCHNMTKKFRDQVKDKLGRIEGNKFCDKLKKSQTQRIIKHKWPDFDVEDDNIADSCAIAAWGVNHTTKQILFEKNKEIAFDMVEMAQKGLTYG